MIQTCMTSYKSYHKISLSFGKVFVYEVLQGFIINSIQSNGKGDGRECGAAGGRGQPGRPGARGLLADEPRTAFRGLVGAPAPV